VGLSLRELARKDETRAYAPVAVVFAGNGSQYIHWLTDLTKSTDGSEFGAVLGRLILTGLGKEAAENLPRVSLTAVPKQEVALGLVARADVQGVELGSDSRTSMAGESFTAKVGDQSIERRFGAADRLRDTDILFPDQVAALAWADGEMEIERFHEAFATEMERLMSYGPQWANNTKAVRDALSQLPRREIQQLTRARLQLISSAVGGFQGSMFVTEATAVAARLQDLFFAPARARASVGTRR
jgi:hypothetical protein